MAYHLTGDLVGTPSIVERIAQSVTFALCFVLLMAYAVVLLLLLLSWRDRLPGAEGSRSLIGGVRSAVHSILSFIP